ncbi:hypothetical protein GQ44DRAFT_780093 [Phaeosphaeriaceae sp. PMI808]|nr:hypothetical protein GQ44DRAFT_780093 [Phaeosphaeriaceae sp. PMI808]
MDIEAWSQQVEGALQNAKFVTSDGAAHVGTHDAGPEVDASEAKEAHGSNLSNFLEQLVADIDLETIDSTSNEVAPQTHESKDEQLALGFQSEQQASHQKEKIDVDNTVIRRCLQSAIPSIAATTGTDILELISIDILNHHLGLNIDLSDSWNRVPKPQSASASIETFLAECAPDPVVQGYEQEEKKTNNRQCLISILETLRDNFEGDVEWKIVLDKVPRAVMRIAVAIAKDGPSLPTIDWSDEDYSIDPFLLMVAEKLDSSLFGTPDLNNPRYW